MELNISKLEYIATLLFDFFNYFETIFNDQFFESPDFPTKKIKSPLS